MRRGAGSIRLSRRYPLKGYCSRTCRAARAGGGPLRSESARLPSVTLALAAPGPPVQLRWTTLRVQGPTLRDAALANGGDGSPPVAPRLLPPLHPDERHACSPAFSGGERGPP